MDAAVSTAAANVPGTPKRIINGMVMVPTTAALAEPLPLIMPIALDPITAVCGINCRDRPATNRTTLIIARCASKPLATPANNRNAAINVSASWP